MNSKQRDYLRRLAQKITPIFQIGKGGVTENFIKMVDDALEAREIIKITLLNNSSEDIKETTNEITVATNCEVIQIIGHKITIFRPSINKPVIQLP